MLVHAVHAGGIPANRTRRQVPTRNRYRVQPDDFWQMPDGWWATATARSLIGHVTKLRIYADGPLPQLPGLRYRVILTTRDPREVSASMRDAYGRLSLYSAASVRRWTQATESHPCVADVHTVDHSAVILDPATVLASTGWPIDAAEAAQAVDTAWWRHRNPRCDR